MEQHTKTRWSVKEDYIVGSFYFKYQNAWRDHFHEVMNDLSRAGFSNRDAGTVRMRIQNFEFLHTGKGLSKASRQTKSIYNVLYYRFNNPHFGQRLNEYIISNYQCKGSINYDDNYYEEKVLTDVSAVKATLDQFSNPSQTYSYITYNKPLGPSFQQVLFGFIDERNMKDSEVYNKAQVRKDTFSAIRCGKNKGVAKNTVMQLCFGLKLSYDEAVMLMESAGFAFSKNNLTDVIVAYYLKNKNYDIIDANISLDESGATTLF